jgi:TonB-dependent starch-binding outer membrane protein SusC
MIKEHTQAQRKTNKTIMLSHKDKKSFAVTRFNGMTVLALFLIMTLTAPLQDLYAVQDNDRSLSVLAQQIVIDRSDEVMTISLDINEMKLSEALEILTSEMGVGLSYSSDTPLDKIITIQMNNVPFHEALYALLEGTSLEPLLPPTKDVLVIREKEEEVETEIYQETVSGTVVDAQTGEPLPGVNVILQGTSTGTATDLNGEFELTLPSLNETLVISYIGYEMLELSIEGQNNLNIQLESQAIHGEDVIVVGYGVQSTRLLSSSVQNIEMEDVVGAPVAQIGQMLQGRLTGVRINQTTGRPGEGLKIQIRGAASLTAGADPLYVVDGIPLSGGIENINPNEIENISVLKDAAATSLYGSRGANGVVLIQTKAATPGDTRINFNASYGVENVPSSRRLNMMNARQYAEFQKEIAELNGRPVDPAFQNPEQYGAGTDWFDTITQTAPVQSYNLTVGTGSETFNTSVTAGYFNQGGVVRETGYERLSLRINSRFNPFERMSIGFNVAPTYSVNTNFPTDGHPYGSGNIISSALITTPLANPYNEDGSLALTAEDPAGFGNPNWLRVAKDQVWNTENQQLLSSAILEYEFLNGFVAKTTANIQLGNTNTSIFMPSTTGALFSPPPRVPSGSENNNRFYNWVNENSISYQRNIQNHNIDFLVGFTAQGFRSEGNNISASNYPDDKIQAPVAASTTSISSNIQEWNLLSYLGRINYNYQEKYLFTLAVRRDGSSRFGPENRWGNFPSASLGWVLSEEDFWNFDPISFLKLRASFGITGNFNIGNYSHISSLGSVQSVFGSSVYSGRSVNNLGVADLGWERNQEFNLGADIYLLDDRIRLEYNYYTKNTSNLLYNVDVPVASGFSNIQTNIGELKFWGHEIGINTDNIRRSNLSWNTNFNMSFDRNEVISLATETSELLHGLALYGFMSHKSEVGNPIGQFYGAVHDGVYVDEDDFNNSPQHSASAVGTVKFKDLNGDGVITFPEDMTYIGNPWPDFTFGITNNFNFRDFDASFSISGSYGNDILVRHLNWTTNLDGVFNVLAEVADRWKSPDDPGAGIYGSTQAGTTFLERDRWQSRHIRDGSHLSVKNITLGYTIPFGGGMLNTIRLYASIQNALLFTKYDGPNPEVNTQSSASGSTPGVDENSYPVPRTFSIGANISF